MRHDKGSHWFDAIRTQLEPQAPGVEGHPCMSKNLRALMGQPATTTTSE